jgi:cell division protease FtsH
MSSLGPIAYGDNHDTVFLGREISRSENYSQETAQRIDREIQKVIDQEYQRAHSIITEKRRALDKIAEALLEYETIDGKHVMEIIEHGEIRSPVYREIPLPKEGEKAPDKDKKPAEKSAPEALGGTAAPAPA